MASISFIALFIVAAAHTPLAAQDLPPGHRLFANRIEVNTAEHWQAWDAPDGVRRINPDGSVEPRFLRRDINALSDAGQFAYVIAVAQEDTVTGGVRQAGTNPEDAPLVLDGDPATYWEPQRDTSIDNWFFTLDLGRTLIARRINLRFVDEGGGDPFLKFRVLISDGLTFNAVQNQTRSLNQTQEFFRVGLVTRPNKNQRQFSFEVEPQRPVAEGIRGEICQFVRIDVLDTDGPRAEEIDQATYETLPPEDQGAIDYFRTTAGGREIAVSQRTYEALSPETRGPIRHYRHERPRLAEVEIIAEGENIIGLTQRGRQRRADEASFDFFLFRTFTDGLFQSWAAMRTYDPLADENQIEIDLGAKYWIERLKLLFPLGAPPVYQMRISDGAINPSGDLIWTTFPERRNPAAHQHVEERFQPQEVRFIEVRRLRFSGSPSEAGNLGEIQAYGEGYVSEVVMRSPFIRLGRPRMFAGIHWDGDAPPNTRIAVRTRSGDEIIEILHYFAITGREISRNLWELLPESFRPPPVVEQVAGPDWSPWSEVSDQSGQPFRSPNPRQAIQVEVRLLSNEPLRAAALRSLRLDFGPPLVDKVLGEIAPFIGVQPGQEQEFTLYIRPLFSAGNPGFDRLSLRSSSTAPMELVEVRAGSQAALRQGTARRLWPGTLILEPGSDDTIQLAFPQPVVRQGEIYALTFRTRVFLQSTVFSADLTRQTRPGLVQTVSPGDATDQVASQTLAVVSDLEQTPLLDQVLVEPPIFTPNGDGINDQTTIQLTVFHLEGDKQLAVGIYTLSGERVRNLSQQTRRPSGEQRFVWDGRNHAGQRQAPGIYLVRVGFATDIHASGTQAVRLVHVVY